MLSLANEEPFQAYDELRKRGPLVWDPGMNCWLAVSYDACKIIETDEDTFHILYADIDEKVREINGGSTGITVLTGEKHAAMRRVFLKMLSPHSIEKYRTAHVLPVINDAIDRFQKRGSAELVEEYAQAIPERVMASLFGLPWRDDALVKQIALWHKDIVAWVGMAHGPGELMIKAQLASDRLNELFLPLVIERKENRGDDFISSLWTQGEKDYPGFGVTEVLHNTREAAVGAGETTANAIANAVYLYLTNSEVHQAITADQEGPLNSFVEETLRLLGSLQWRFRVAGRDATVLGVDVKKGDLICNLHAAANRDPSHYGCPHAIDLARKAPTDHLALNVGPRLCVGMHLARMLIREGMKTLIERLPELRLDPSKEKPRFRNFSHRSYGPLNVLF
ncbi:cytochrome P450 [Caballeronia sp. EK]|uniref:cytochrome P450 n=1 Tax=Caballeronia sp. EK TaxID=2767469 RepID=UPI0016556A43|nr:cytochrome P450 [Caballeronia sp. EK]MBC8641646.1 cytochrome P450 [Caballeronia sp. EK]